MEEQIPTICRNVDDAVKALRTGRDANGNPITTSEIGQGLQRLVDHTRQPGFSQMMALALRPDGIAELESSITELASIAASLVGQS